MPSLLVFLTTSQCPLECAHCIVDSSPRRSDYLNVDRVLGWIDDAASLGVSTVGFSGGEPFMRPAELRSFVERAHSRNLKTVVITSGFFAHSERNALRVLEPFADVSMLGISADAFHQEFTRLENVRNVIRAARALGIARIEVQVAYLNKNEVDHVRAELDADNNDVIVRGQVIWPVGRAASMSGSMPAALRSIDDLDLQCPMVGPVVTPTGGVKGCCSALLDLGEDNPLALGDLATQSLSDIFEAASTDTYYNSLKMFGLQPVVNALRASEVFSLQAGYTDVCHLCHDIHSDPLARQHLREMFRP
jgi:organic radical activating enzyme